MSDAERLLAWLLAVSSCGEPAPSAPRTKADACGTGNWCGTPEAALAIRSADAVVVDGCPHQLSVLRPAGDVSKALLQERPYRTLMRATDPVVRVERASQPDDDGVLLCCYRYTIDCPGGRPLVVGDGAIVAEGVPGGGWHDARAPLGTLLPPATRRVIAQMWLDDALAEHASIASFARTTVELMAVGAPPQLLSDVQRAAHDEVQHARQCFAFAAAYGMDRGPGPLPIARPRVSEFARLAIDTFAEACVGESTAALLAERCAAACTIPEVAAALRRIAVDEARHAALGWRTLAWLFERAPAVIERVRALAERLRPVTPTDADAGDAILRAHGRASPHDRQRTWADALGGVVEPMLDAITRGLVGRGAPTARSSTCT